MIGPGVTFASFLNTKHKIDLVKDRVDGRSVWYVLFEDVKTKETWTSTMGPKHKAEVTWQKAVAKERSLRPKHKVRHVWTMEL